MHSYEKREWFKIKTPSKLEKVHENKIVAKKAHETCNKTPPSSHY